ncbi:DUF4003 family protein [Oceanobacillus bengalensis]|uniref:DUF4003 domain-containing protein n=1 Tax=Oceanobacillus bengalensis TaxID=1435466 RepID=A0A494YZJ4_9BACI|nr:DUF4003 family protein [Oceanobacillus bengalensis]RKQ15427.1 DUF4003 domain-containing protein [Oceanobacillus bengalensis]
MHLNKVNTYTNVYETLSKKLKWKVSDKRILMTIASIYVMNNQELDTERFINIADQIKAQAGLFSSMKSESRYTTAATLDVYFDDPISKIPTLFELYDIFRKQKFASGNFTYIAATVLLTNENRAQQPTGIIRRAKEIFDDMRKEHLFLTGYEDYPLATLLALEDRPGIIAHIEKYYEELNKSGFSKGNDLQFLSHILSLEKEASVHDLVSRCSHIHDAFQGAGIRPKKSYYPVIGILALLPPAEVDMDSIREMYEALNSEIKWQKEMNVILAVSLFVKEKLEDNGLTEASIQITLEAILQAQQAVMVSTIAASTAAASASNNGSS